MGNQLVGIAPSQIFPVERYLTEHPEFKFDLSLGSTRFLKVARAESQEGLVVVKVFAIHDPSLPLSTYKDQLEDIRKKLASAVNCIPFQKIILTDKAALIMREYVKYSLYDRLSTRPFLTDIEKRWITFQILYALHQCHKVGVCHGDIKLENITVTSWNWILLVDFASFKPTFVPEDNPADYSYFFDTSRRRTCYIAPERFSKATSTENSALISETACDDGDLTPAMDIFSTGCALLELWNELHVPFEYSQLLAYRAGKYSPQKNMDKLEDPALKDLISSMIEIDPSKRLSAEEYLSREKGRLFPEYFFSFLQPYILIFSSTPILLPDEKISRLKADVQSILRLLDSPKTEGSGEKVDKRECEGLVLVTSLVTSCIRGLHDCSSKLDSLDILFELAKHASNVTILDRILPYIMYLAKDNTPRVKISAINTITKCLDLVQELPRSDSNIFPEYVLPGLAPLAQDPNTCVRAAYAKNIATLAEIALRYLDQIQNDWYDNTLSKQKYTHTFNYELELQALHEMVEQTVSVLLEDPQALVKQTLIEYGITKLCVFFGKQKANDVVLSHMITFLNDKDDKQLRGSFYECIVGVAAFIGWHCSGILTPLLLQGLTDSCEFVTAKSINAMAALTELGLLTKTSVCEVVAESSCFLVHPNLWIRQAVVGLVTTTAKKLPILDVQCKIMPLLKDYMRHPLIQIDKPELLLEALVSPIPRIVYDMVATYTDIDKFIETLKDRKYVRDEARNGKVISFDYASSIRLLITRLEANEMTESVEEYFLLMKNHLKKINKHRLNSNPRNKLGRHSNNDNGKIELKSASCNVKSHTFHLGETQKVEFSGDRLQRINTFASIDTNVNSDWNYSSEVTRHSESTNSGGMSSRSTSSRPSSPPPDIHTPFASAEPSSNMSLHERSYIQYRRSSCYLELYKLKSKQQDHYFGAFRNKEWAEKTERTSWSHQLPPPEWQMRGVLVAHLHEHRAAVRRLCTIPEKPLFASCSADGFVRLWDVDRMEGKNIANRSKQFYKLPGNVAFTSMAVCDGGQGLGAAGRDGSLNILRLDPAGNKMALIKSRQLNLDEDGYVVDVQCLDSGYQNTLIYATLYGSLVGWDLRAPGTAWRLENGRDKGYVTTFCVDSYQNLLTLGTNSGRYNVFDLRFQLPINSFEEPSEERGSERLEPIKKVVSHPTEKSWIIASVEGNNKMLMWNLETKMKEKILWGSTAPPLSQTKTQSSSSSVCALLAGCIDRSPFLISGGSDQTIRFWNLNNPKKSYVAVPAANDHSPGPVTYDSRQIDGYHVVCENAAAERVRDSSEEAPRGGPEQPPAGHRDCITDIALCRASQCFTVSASREGIIKVWK